MVKTMSVKNNKEERKDYWRHNMILKNKKDFQQYLEELTDIDWLINNIKENKLLQKLMNDNNVVKNFVNRVLMFIDEEIKYDLVVYLDWKSEKIKEYVKYFVELIQEEQTYKNEVEITRFRKRMKQKRNSFNFIIEYIYSYHNNQRKIVSTRLDKEFSKKEYVNLLLIIMNILLTYQFIYNLYGYEIEKTYTVDDEETINRKLKNLNIFSSMIELEIIFKWLNNILFQTKFLSENIEGVNND